MLPARQAPRLEPSLAVLARKGLARQAVSDDQPRAPDLPLLVGLVTDVFAWTVRRQVRLTAVASLTP